MYFHRMNLSCRLFDILLQRIQVLNTLGEYFVLFGKHFDNTPSLVLEICTYLFNNSTKRIDNFSTG